MDSFNFDLGLLAISGEGHFAVTLAALLSAVLVFAIVRGGTTLPTLWRIKPPEKPSDGDDD